MMEKLASKALVVAMICLGTALVCLFAAYRHRPSAMAAHVLIAIAGIATFVMIGALARMEKELRNNG